MKEELEKLLIIDKENSRDAISILYDKVYDYIINKDYESCNYYLDEFIKNDISVKLQVALLTITKPLNIKLKNRDILILKLKEQMISEQRTQIEIDNIISTLRA